MMELQRDIKTKTVQDPSPGHPITLTTQPSSVTSLPWYGSMPDLTLINEAGVVTKRNDSGGGIIKVERDKRETSPYSRSPSPRAGSRSNSPRQVFLNHRDEFRPPGDNKTKPKSNSLQIPGNNRQRSNSDSKIPSYSSYTSNQDNLYTSPQEPPPPLEPVNHRLGGLGVPIRTSVIRSPSPRRKTVSDFFPREVIQDPSVSTDRKLSHPSHLTFPEIVITHHEEEDPPLATYVSCQATLSGTNSSYLSGGYRNPIQSQ